MPAMRSSTDTTTATSSTSRLTSRGGETAAMDLVAFQDLMARTYGERDRARGVPATVAWLTEELGELARAVRKGDDPSRLHELGDVLAWLASLADQLGLSLDEAAARYREGCPRCGAMPCGCEPA